MDIMREKQTRNIIRIILCMAAILGACALCVYLFPDEPLAVVLLPLGMLLSYSMRPTGGGGDTKEREEQYRDELLEALLRHEDDVFVLFDSDGSAVSFVSANVERLLGVTREQVLQDPHLLEQTLADGGRLISPEDLSGLKDDGRISREREYIHRKSRERHWCRETIYRMDLRGNDMIVAVIADRTRELQTSKDMRDELETVRADNEAKNSFLSSMSHDIRTPMNAIIGFATLLGKNAEDTAQVQEYAKKISTSGQHLLGLINDMLDMSRIESGKTSLNISEFSVPVLLEELGQILLPQIKAKHQDFEVRVKGKVPETLLGDRMRVNQVLMNLVSDASKYTPEHEKIELTVYRLEAPSPDFSHLRFVVRDSGVDAADDSAGERELGMAITKNIVELMGGNIDVQSQPGSGTVCVVELEFAIPQRIEELRLERGVEAAEDAAGESPSAQSMLDGMLFLVVEDIGLNAELLSAMLSVEGARCEIAENGQRALEMFRNSEPGYYDIILMDVEMPIMNGYDATRAIRRCGHPDAKSIRIIAMTANAFLEDVQNALDAGMDAHVAKPVDMEVVKQTIQRLRLQG